jgi:hypothetical protein
MNSRANEGHHFFDLKNLVLCARSVLFSSALKIAARV